MKKIIISHFFIIFTISLVYPAFEFLYPGGRSTGMGGAYTAVSNDIEAMGYNPAGLINIRRYNLFGSQKELFGGPDGLKHSVFNFGYGTKKLGGVGFSYDELGYSLHKEKTFQLSYGKKLNRFLGVGINLKYYKISISQFGSDNSYGIDLGYLSKIYKNVYLGLNLKNINNPKVGTSIRKGLNKSVTGGLSYINNFLALSMDVMKEPDYDVQIRYGGELVLFNFIALRLGANNDPDSRFFGFGFNFKNLKLSFSQYSHEYLPSTHQMSLTILFGKKTSTKESELPKTKKSKIKKSPEQFGTNYIQDYIKKLKLFRPEQKTK